MKIYENRLFKHFYEREKLSALQQLEVQGAAISDTAKHEQYIISNAKFSYWAFFVVLSFVLYQLINYLLMR